jgi:hypothetical protein
VPAIDRLRAAALVLMLIHHFTKWLAGDPRHVIPGWDGFVVTDLAAPAFTIAAGASAVLFVESRLARGMPGPAVFRTVLRRYGLLVPIGMVIQWLFTSHVPFDWGVLQALGTGVVVSTAVAMIVWSPRMLGVCAMAALVAGPMAEAAAEGHTGRLADIAGGVFPAVTYIGFALLGAVGGRLLDIRPDRGLQALRAGAVLAGVTAVMIAGGMPPDRYPGGAAFIVPGIAGTLLLYGGLDRLRSMPAAFGNHTLGIFCAHYVACWAITVYGLRGSFSPGWAVLVGVAAVVVFAVVAPRVPQRPWSPRTGWARRARPPQKRLASSAA